MQQLNRILVVRIGRVGDMVMMTPAIQSLLVKFPLCNITLLTTRDGKRTFNGFSERLDKILLYDRKSVFPWLTRRRIKKALNHDRYAAVYCFESNPGFFSLFDALNCPVHKLVSIADKRIHFSQYCLNLIAPDNANNTNNAMAYSLTLPLTEQAKRDARVQLKTLGIDDSTFVIGLHPSFSGLAKSFGRAKKHSHHKVWPLDYWSELAIKLDDVAKQKQLNIKIVMDLVPEERHIGASINKQSNGAALYQCPPLNFERYKATLARYDLLITPNSGPMHIAAAVNTNLIALFSRHLPSDCQPFVAQDQFSVLCAEQMANPDKGLAAIEPQTVLDACLHYLPKP